MAHRSDLKFTIIITTRNRCETLPFTIKTCLAVDWDDYEILVSDNCSSDGTRQVVERFDSDRIRYVVPPERLAMTEHWEFAISHVEEGFVTIMGDDDGLLRNSLRRANELIRKTGTKALAWKKMEYCWPDHIYPPFRGYMSIPLFNDVFEFSSRERLGKFVRREIGYNELPCIYNSFISVDLLREASKANARGYLFDSSCPDVYSGIVFSLFTDRYVYTDEPLSINGASKNSNGTALRFRHIESTEGELFRSENAASTRSSGIFEHPQGLVVAELLNALLRAKENYPGLLADVKIDRAAFLKAIAREYSVMRSDAPYFLASKKELLEHAEREKVGAEVEAIVDAVVGTASDPAVHHGLNRFAISFNSECLKVKDVFSASVLASSILAWTTMLPSRQTLRKCFDALGFAYLKRKLVALRNRLRYRRQYGVFKATHGQRFSVEDGDRQPCLEDGDGTTSFDKHYVYHTAWAARKLKETAPAEHVDVSSLTTFSTLVSAFVPIRFYDYRPVRIELDGFSCEHADITALPFDDDSIPSLSSMHVVEHIGLGRYGDPLDVDGDLKAIEELKRVLAVGGNLFFVVPIGKAKIHFNAHRIYSYGQVLSYFEGFDLREFALIPDRSDEGILLDASEEQADLQDYGCGCFWFRKRDAGHGRNE